MGELLYAPGNWTDVETSATEVSSSATGYSHTASQVVESSVTVHPGRAAAADTGSYASVGI